MIHFFFEEQPEIVEENYKPWIESIILNEGNKVGDINYIFCDDEYLLKINQDYLQHDYFTDIITFDYCKGKTISGDIFVSLPRVFENAKLLNKEQTQELRRVIAHGVLHLCGYKDKEQEDVILMRNKEDFYINSFSQFL